MADRDYTIVGPDGREFTISGPDNATPEQLRAAAGRAYASMSAAQQTEQSVGDKIRQGAKDVVAGAVRGAGSIGATILAPIDAGARALNGGKPINVGGYDIVGQDRRAGMDAGLREMGADTNSLPFKAGKLGAEIAGTAGVGGAVANVGRAVLPASVTASPAVANALMAIQTGGAQGGGIISRSIGGAINGGLSAGMVNPEDAASGAVIGGVTPGVLSAAGKAGSAVGNLLRPTPANRPLADAAINKFGIPLGPADVSSSPTTKALRSVLNDAPITGMIGDKQREAVQAGFNKAVGGTFGAPEAKLTPDVMDKAKKTLGAEFDRIWNNNALQVDGTKIQKVMDLQRAATKLPKGEGGSLNAELDDLLSKVTTDAAGNPVIPGDVANKFQSYLRRRAEGSSGLKNELGDLRQTIISAFNRSVSPADAAALTQNRGAYKAFKTVEPILNSAEAGVAGRAPGDVPAGLLPGAVLRSYGNASGTDLGQLSQIGSQFIADRVARTGGSTRAAIQNGAIGSALGMGALSNPLAAAALIPAAAGTNALLGSPRLARAIISRSGQNPNALANPLVYRALPVLAADQ